MPIAESPPGQGVRGSGRFHVFFRDCCWPAPVGSYHRGLGIYPQRRYADTVEETKPKDTATGTIGGSIFLSPRRCAFVQLRSERGALRGNKLTDTFLGEGQHRVHFLAREG